jgi:hypothetical protein
MRCQINNLRLPLQQGRLCLANEAIEVTCLLPSGCMCRIGGDPCLETSAQRRIVRVLAQSDKPVRRFPRRASIRAIACYRHPTPQPPETGAPLE